MLKLVWEDLSLEVTADGLGGEKTVESGDRRQDPRYERKTYRRDLLYERSRNSSWHKKLSVILLGIFPFPCRGWVFWRKINRSKVTKRKWIAVRIFCRKLEVDIEGIEQWRQDAQAYYGHYIIGQAIIFCLVISIFPSSSIFFHRLISAVGDWMSTILPHMVWSQCRFRMHVWNVLHAPHWKIHYRTQKNRHFVRHYRTICRAVSSQLRHASTIGKKLSNSNTFSACPHNMVNFDPLTAEICRRVWGTQQISTGFVSWQRYCTAV